MNTQIYRMLEAYMRACMDDSAHDTEHIYRVLYTALDIAGCEGNADTDVLVAACLLHDIGRKEQYADPRVCHAAAGADKAFAFLVSRGFDAGYAEHVSACIRTHRFRAGTEPQSIEAKIVFDADKIDVTGALGISRTLLYCGQLSEPLYALTPDGGISDGADDTEPSFFQEYKYKLEGLYNRFYTKRGAEIALQRQAAASAFYDAMLREARASYRPELLEKVLRA